MREAVNKGKGFRAKSLKRCAVLLPYAKTTSDGLAPVDKGVERLVQYQELARIATTSVAKSKQE